MRRWGEILPGLPILGKRLEFLPIVETIDLKQVQSYLLSYIKVWAMMCRMCSPRGKSRGSWETPGTQLRDDGGLDLPGAGEGELGSISETELTVHRVSCSWREKKPGACLHIGAQCCELQLGEAGEGAVRWQKHRSGRLSRAAPPES